MRKLKKYKPTKFKAKDSHYDADAADRQQATIVFDVAANMVRMCPALSKRVKILTSQKRIIYQPNRKLFDVMTKGSGDARMQPLYFLITTAGTDTNSICYETHQKALDIYNHRSILFI